MDNKKIKGKLDEKQDMLRRLAMPDVMQVRLDTQYRSMSLIFLATPFRWRPLSFQKDFH